MIGAGIVAKAVGCVYAEIVALWRLLAEGLQQIAAGLVLIGGLLFPRVVLVAAATDELAGEHAGISLYRYALRIAVVQVGNGHPRGQQARGALKEHEADGHAVELLRAYRTRSLVGCAAMLLVASAPVLFIAVQRLTKTGAAKLASMVNVCGPGWGPADGLDEAAGLAKGKSIPAIHGPGFASAASKRS